MFALCILFAARTLCVCHSERKWRFPIDTSVPNTVLPPDTTLFVVWWSLVLYFVMPPVLRIARERKRPRLRIGSRRLGPRTHMQPAPASIWLLLGHDHVGHGS